MRLRWLVVAAAAVLFLCLGYVAAVILIPASPDPDAKPGSTLIVETTITLPPP